MAGILFLLKTIPKALSVSLLAVVFAGQALMPGPLRSEVQDGIESKQVERRAVQDKLSAGKAQVRKLEAEETAALRDLDQLNLQLIQLRKRLRETRRQIDQLEKNIATSNTKRKSLAEDVQRLESYAVERLVAFYKLASLSIAPILFSADSILGLWQRQEALRRILEYDARVWNRLQGKKSNLETLSRELTTQKLQQDRLQLRLEDEKATLEGKRSERAKLLARIRADKKLTLASIESLKEAAKELDQAVRALENRPRSPLAGRGLEMVAFHALKGSLPRPLPGRLVGLFGPYIDQKHYNIKSFRSGVNIKADVDTPVRAVCKGRVVYADWFKGYSNMVIIDHGEHYYTLSAQLDEILKKTGDTVFAREVIGTVGDTGTLTGPGLYFEIRHHGKPLDPVVWFKK
jgi:septal ring factor EnvC (AmiA/AmiB activator)